MAKNSSLNAASVAKQDEFYTQYKDIQSELNNYTKHFADKTYYAIVMIRLRVISANSFWEILIIWN